jgi:type VI secretion system protein ImpH
MNASPVNAASRCWQEWLELPDREARQQAVQWDWFALLRLIQCATPGQPRLGYSPSPSREPVRLGQPAFFHPPATTVADFSMRGPREMASHEVDDGDARPRAIRSGGSLPPSWIYSHHLGLFGPYGPLPLHLTEYAHQRMRDNDPAFFAFCNVLVHRLLTLFFRAWAEGHKEVSLDRPTALSPTQHRFARQDIGQHGEDWWRMYVGSLIGCGLDSHRACDRLPEDAKLFYAGRMLPHVRNAEGLRAIIEDYFELPATVVEFQARTLPIPESAQWRLAEDRMLGRLSWTTLVGTTVVDYQSGFRIRLGPLSLSEFKRFLPGQDGFDHLHDWVRFYCGKETDPNPEAGLEAAWDVQLVLRGDEVPKYHLDGTARLSLTTFLYSSPPAQDVRDVVLAPRIGRVKAAA